MKRSMTFMLGLALLTTTAVAICTPTPELQKEEKVAQKKKSTPEKKSTKQPPSTTSSK
jgi:hypothetical protein